MRFTTWRDWLWLSLLLIPHWSPAQDLPGTCTLTLQAQHIKQAFILLDPPDISGKLLAGTPSTLVYPRNTVVRLSAPPSAEKSVFSRWDGVDSQFGPVGWVNMDSNTTATAEFSRLEPYLKVSTRISKVWGGATQVVNVTVESGMSRNLTFELWNNETLVYTWSSVTGDSYYGNYNLGFPADGPFGEGYRVRILAREFVQNPALEEALYTATVGPFKILNPCEIRNSLRSSYRLGELFTIQWDGLPSFYLTPEIWYRDQLILRLQYRPVYEPEWKIEVPPNLPIGADYRLRLVGPGFTREYPTTFSILPAIEFVKPEEGDIFAKNSKLKVHWLNTPPAGTANEFELWHHGDFAMKFENKSWNPNREGTIELFLPLTLRDGGDYHIRAYSTWDRRYWAESAAFSIFGNAATEIDWTQYD